MPDTRALKRRLEELKHQPPKEIKINEGGRRLLRQAEGQHKERKRINERDTYDMAYEAAGDLINLGRGRVLTYGGFGSGYRLGAGKWRYINGKWEKKE
jgi:hypothetical protein